MKAIDAADLVKAYFCECRRCGHKWFKRRAAKPKVCPKCHVINWDSPTRGYRKKGETVEAEAAPVKRRLTWGQP